MAAPPISRLPTPPPQPRRPFSRSSNLSESYVYPHTDIHPLTLADTSKPRFHTTTKPTPPPLEQSIFLPTSPLPPSPSASLVDLCLPRTSTPACVHVDPTYNAPLSVALAGASLDRFALSTLSANTLHRSRQAVEEDEEEGRRRKDEEVRVKYARQAARRRVAEEERRKREEVDRRIQRLPLHVRQLVYQRWEQATTTNETQLQTSEVATVSENASVNSQTTQPAATAAPDTQHTMYVHDLEDPALANQTAATQRPDGTTAAVRHDSGSVGGRPVMSRDEQRLFQLRVQQLARHKERLELHRVIALRKQEAAHRQHEKQERRKQQQEAAMHQRQQQQHEDTIRATQPPPPAHGQRRPLRHSASVPATPRNRPPMLSWLYDELERRLRTLGDVSVAPLCACSRGGGGGVGRGLTHLTACVWVGRDEAYAMKLLERVEELERAKAEQVQEEKEQQRSKEVELDETSEQKRTAQASKHSQRRRATP